MKEYKFSEKIEDLSREEIERRIKEIHDLDIKGPLIWLPYHGTDEYVEYKTEEVIARCPMTGYPDIYSLSVIYVPDKRIVELKSLKLYLYQYIDIPISHEEIADKIHKDLVWIMKPKKLDLSMRVNIRGGIETSVEKFYDKEKTE